MRRAACLVLVLALGACAGAPRLADGVDWAARRDTLEGVSDWRMSGRVAVAVRGEGASGNLEWHESGGVSDLRISGPFGAGALRVTLGPQGMRLEDGEGTWLEGEQAERLLAERLGAEVPLAALRHWVLGAPAPGVPFAGLPGSHGGSPGFNQAGWQVSVDRWQPAPGNVLPARLTLERDGTRIRLAVTRWELAP